MNGGAPVPTSGLRGRSRLRWVAALAALLLIAVACSKKSPTTNTPGGSAAAGTTIPQATVKFGYYPCCADHAIFTVAAKKGFFRDVGIKLDPPEGHLYTVFDQITPSMQRGDFNIAATFVQGYLQTLATFGQNIPPILFHDIYVKYPSDLKLQFLEDTKIVELSAQAGRVEFAIPYAAPVLVQMLRNGYKPIIDTQQVLNNDVGSAEFKQMTKLVGSSGLMAQRSWVEKNTDTAMRFISAIYRTLHFLGDPATQQEGWKIEADIINATQGLRLIPEDIGVIFRDIDPLFPWEDQGPKLWDDPSAQFYVEGSLKIQIQSLIDDGTLPNKQYDIRGFLVAKDLFEKMKALQTEAKGLLSKGDSAGLSGAKADLLKKAHQYYDWYDFLDAVRFAKAATA